MLAIRIARVGILLALTLTAYFCSSSALEATRASYQRESPRSPEPTVAEEAAAKEIVEQSKALETWTLALLTGILAISVTQRVHQVKYAEWLYIPLGPASALLAVSLQASWVLRKRFTFLLLQKRVHEYETLMALLQDQTFVFEWALRLTGLFGAFFLLGIVFGSVRPFEQA